MLIIPGPGELKQEDAGARAQPKPHSQDRLSKMDSKTDNCVVLSAWATKVRQKNSACFYPPNTQIMLNTVQREHILKTCSFLKIKKHEMPKKKKKARPQVKLEVNLWVCGNARDCCFVLL